MHRTCWESQFILRFMTVKDCYDCLPFEAMRPDSRSLCLLQVVTRRILQWSKLRTKYVKTNSYCAILPTIWF